MRLAHFWLIGFGTYLLLARRGLPEGARYAGGVVAVLAAPGVLRIAAFGESFTFGSDVPLGENWAKRIPALARSIEVLNYGVPAYGLDQAYLRYLAVGAEYHPHIVLIGYMSENLARNVNVYRGFYSKAYRDTIFTKPRFKIEKGSLTLVKNPLATIDAYRALRADEGDVLRAVGRQDFHFVGLYDAGPFRLLSDRSLAEDRDGRGAQGTAGADLHARRAIRRALGGVRGHVTITHRRASPERQRAPGSLDLNPKEERQWLCSN